MFGEEKRAGNPSVGSLSKRIISKLIVLVAVMFFLIVSVSGLISMVSLESVTKDKMQTLAYENVFLIRNQIENSYGQALGFSNSLRNISALPPSEQRDAIDNALKGFLLGDENFTTVFAYFEQNAIADANGEPYSVHKRDIAYEAIAYFNEDGTEVEYEKHEDAFDNFDKEYYKYIKSSGQAYVMEPYVYQLKGKDIMMISIIAPMYDADGEFLGVAGCDVALADMQTQQYARIGYETIHMVLLSEDNTILLDTDNGSLVGKTAKEAGYDQMAEDVERLNSMEGGPNVNSVSVMNGSTINYSTGKKGIAVTVPMKLASGNKWSLRIAINRGEFDKALLTDVAKLMIAVIFFGIVLLCTIYQIIKKHLAPVQEILDGASKLEAGDLEINIAVDTNDELGRMAKALNHISATMVNYVDDISRQLSQMASNDMDVAIRHSYIGDFIPMRSTPNPNTHAIYL